MDEHTKERDKCEQDILNERKGEREGERERKRERERVFMYKLIM